MILIEKYQNILRCLLRLGEIVLRTRGVNVINILQS